MTLSSISKTLVHWSERTLSTASYLSSYTQQTSYFRLFHQNVFNPFPSATNALKRSRLLLDKRFSSLPTLLFTRQWGGKNQQFRLPQNPHMLPGLAVLSLFGIKTKKEDSLLTIKYQASAYECAVLSDHTYQDNLKIDSAVVVEGKNQPHKLRGWKVAKVYTNCDGGYYGAIYVNHDKRQIVVAHRGTASLAALKTDLQGVVLNNYVEQQKFLTTVIRDVFSLAKLWGTKAAPYTVTSTGHSLGGWLSQLFLLMIKASYSDFLTDGVAKGHIAHFSAVAFDPPGAYPMIKQMIPGASDASIELDITLYFSSPNPVNCCNTHYSHDPDSRGKFYSLGSMYRIVFDFSHMPSHYNFPISPSYLSGSHSRKNFVESFDQKTGKEKKCLRIVKWPIFSPDSFSNLLSQWLKGETFGAYSHFFKLAEASNQYNPKGQEFTAQYDSEKQKSAAQKNFFLKYKAHYITQPRKNLLHFRHLPAGMSNFALNISTQNNLFPFQENVDIDLDQRCIKTSLPIDIRLVADQIHELACRDQKKLFQKIFSRADSSSIPLIREPLAIPMAEKNFVGRKAEINRLSTIFANSDRNTLTLAPPIVGFSGMGKSKMALQILEHCKKNHYDHILWIDCKAAKKQSVPVEISIQNAYAEIYNKFQLGPYDLKLKEKAKLVHAHLKEKFCCYVFDDAPGFATIAPYLPTKGHVLITSTNSAPGDWNQDPLRLKPLKQSEAAQFVQDETGLQRLKEVKLPLTPLALKQFTSLIKNGGYTTEQIPSLIQDENLPSLLKKTSSSTDKKIFTEIIAKNIDMIQKQDRGDQTLNLLLKLSLLDGQNIPFDWALTLDTTDSTERKDDTRASLFLLEKHSFIEWDRKNQQLRMHNDLQLNIRRFAFKQNSNAKTKALDHLVDEWIKTIDQGSIAEKAARSEELLHHGRVLFSHLEKTSNQQKLTRLASWLGEACSRICFLEEEVFWRKKALEVCQEIYKDQDHPDVARSLNNLGLGLKNLGQLKEGVKLLQEALDMRKRIHKNKDYPDVAYSLNNVGSGLKDLGQLKEGVKLQQEALDMLKRIHKNKSHPGIAIYLSNVGLGLENLGQLQEGVKLQQEALEMLKRIHKNKDHPNVATSLNTVGSGLCNLGQLKEGLELQQEALEMLKRIHKNKDHPSIASSLNSVSSSLYNLGQLKEGMKLQQEALEMLKRIHKNKDHPDVAYSLDSFGSGLCNLGQRKEGMKLQQEALEMLKRIHKNKDHPNVACSLTNFGSELCNLGQLKEGLEIQQEALEMLKRIHKNKDHPSIASSLNNFGVGLENLGQLKEGVKLQQEALEMLKRIHKNKDHPSIASSLNNVGSGLKDLGQLKEGVKLQQEALEMRKRIYKNKDHPDVASSLNSVGVGLYNLGQLKEGVKLQQEALEMLKRIHKNKDHPDVAASLNNIGLGLCNLGQLKEGVKLQQEALEMRKRTHKNKDHPDVASSLNSVGVGLYNLGQLKEGVKLLQEALEMLKRIHKNKDHPDVAASLKNVGSGLKNLGQLKEGVKLQQEAFDMLQRIHKNKDHPDATDSLNNLGLELENLGQPK